MKLQGDHTSFIDEPLIEACCTAGNPNRSLRQAEGVAMPVESFEFVGEVTEDERPARFAALLDREPSDFLVAISENPSSQDVRQKLGTQADSENGLFLFNRHFDESLFFAEPGVNPVIIDTHRAAHCDQPIYLIEVRQRVPIVKACCG